jgi:hypothetical protein
MALPLRSEFNNAAIAKALAELEADLGLGSSIGAVGQTATATALGARQGEAPMAWQQHVSSSTANGASRGLKIASKSPAISLPPSFSAGSALSKACLPTPELMLNALDADAQHPADRLEDWLIASVSSGKSRQQPTSVSLMPCVQGLVRGSSFLAAQQMAVNKRENRCIGEWIRKGQCTPHENAQAEEEEGTAWKFLIDDFDISRIDEPQLPLSRSAYLFAELPPLMSFESLCKCGGFDAGP